MSDLNGRNDRRFNSNFNQTIKKPWANRSSVDSIVDFKESFRTNRVQERRFRPISNSATEQSDELRKLVSDAQLNSIRRNDNFFNPRRHMSSAHSYSKSSRQEKENDWFKIQERSEEYEKRAFSNTIKSGINFDKYDEIPVKISGKNVTLELEADLNKTKLSDVFKQNMLISGYTKLTPIQKYAFSCLLERHDMLGCAQTGSGKTAAFVLPIINHIYNEGYFSPRETSGQRVATCTPKALIMAPTRELASQIFEQVVKFSYRTRIRPGLFYGGVPVKEQYNALRGCGHLIIGTPGRIYDMYKRGYISFKFCNFMVLDEADRMLDMGFEPQIRSILSESDMPGTEHRLNCMFSATFPDGVKHLVREYMNDYVMVTIGKVGGATSDVAQKVIRVTPSERFDRLQDYLTEDDRILIFTETKLSAEDVEISLYNLGYKAVGIHGSRTQQERDMALSLFKRNKANIMVATGVASRGLDIPNVSRVIIYECPTNIEEYVHRIGRTGRAGNLGEAVVFFTNGDYVIAQSLAKVLSDSKQHVPDFLLERTPPSFTKGYSFNQHSKSYKKTNYRRSANENYYQQRGPKPNFNSDRVPFGRGSIDSDKW